MSMEYIRVMYNIPIRRGMEVRFHSHHFPRFRLKSDQNGKISGKVSSAKNCVYVLTEHNGKKLRLMFRPRDLEYLIDGEWKSYGKKPKKKEDD